MTHTYEPQEMVTITCENYDEIKDGYDSIVTDMQSEIDDLEEENEKLRSAVCIINITSFSMLSGTTFSREFKNSKSEMYEELSKYFSKIEDVEKFKNSFIGKTLNFFGIKL